MRLVDGLLKRRSSGFNRRMESFKRKIGQVHHHKAAKANREQRRTTPPNWSSQGLYFHSQSQFHHYPTNQPTTHHIAHRNTMRYSSLSWGNEYNKKFLPFLPPSAPLILPNLQQIIDQFYTFPSFSSFLSGALN